MYADKLLLHTGVNRELLRGIRFLSYRKKSQFAVISDNALYRKSILADSAFAL